MLTQKYILFLFIAFILVSCAYPASSQDTLILKNGLLIDGKGGEPIRDAVIIIRGEQIVTAGTRMDVKIPLEVPTIDLNGATILPGFINAHVHYAFDEEKLNAWATAGVTTVRDEAIISSEPLEYLMELRDTANQNPKNARLISAGYMMTVPGGYGDLFVTSAEDAQQKVIDQLEAGVDLIKISLEDGYAGSSDLPKLTPAEINAILNTAHERHVHVSGHITQANYLETLVNTGVDDIAHVPYDLVADDVWQQMAAKNIYLTPTFTVYRNYNAPISTCVHNLRKFLAYGGQVALGNDYGGGPGEFEIGIPMYEIEQMKRAGMTPMQIIIASTKNAAFVSGVIDQLGTLEAGKYADILIVSGNPLDDIQNLQNIRMVIHSGTIIRDDNN